MEIIELFPPPEVPTNAITTVASGTKAWKTKLNGNYNDEELSYLYSPCYNITGMTNPTLSLSIALDLEDCGGTLCDGAYFEYSKEGIKQVFENYVMGKKNGPFTYYFENDLIYRISYHRSCPKCNYKFYNTKKQEIEKATKKYKTFVLFYEKELTASTTKLVLPLEIDGWLIIAGEAQVNAYVSTFGRLKAFSQNGNVKVATPQMIPVDMLVANPLNRDEVKEGVVNIAKSIINDGFLTCLYVVPVMKNGKIVNYMLFEGHHRLSAVKLAAKWGHEIKELPCVVVDWVTTDDMERVSELLIKINPYRVK